MGTIDEGFSSGQKVRMRANPGKIGQLTGEVRQAGGFTLYEVEFGPNDRPWIRASQLESLPKHESMYDLFHARRFGGPEDLSRIIVTAKLAGDLTNVFYSMEIGNTDFLPHQFRPVMKFIESQRGRLLIADEVGLGKTIEAIYIWKELQAREAARRLLVVCPSMLREKWKRDFEIRFGIEAEIVDAQQLVDRITGAERMPSSRSFVLIASLEGIRAKEDDWDMDSRVARHKLCGFLEQNANRSSDFIFDLIVIDEAHYLRNASTASFKTAALLRENSPNLILLSATPIQTSDENLYNLLTLLSPEDYTNYRTFEELRESNSHLLALENAIKYRGDIAEASEIFNKIEKNETLIDSVFSIQLKTALQKDKLSKEERIDLARDLAERSFTSRYINRTRKRDAFENRVIRVAKRVDFRFSDYEKDIYDEVTDFLRKNSPQEKLISVFVLIARQRQMTSSLPAAFRFWKDNKSMDETLWDDLGFFENESLSNHIVSLENSFDIPIDVELEKLEKHDSKYIQLKEEIKKLLQEKPSEKLIIFSFYRGTISYLERRLNADGFKVLSIMGGMGEEKYRIIESFASKDGPNILISSEVGAEGIDLQFCHIIINYDLPWNPMKLEQRIGRIDRIGQKSDRIFIYNISCQNTIEDRVLEKLYSRIRIFEESIGDMEDILGEALESLALDIINPELTDDERERRMEQNSLAIIQKRKLQNELEDKAIDFFGFSDYIIRSISDAKSLDRYVGPIDTIDLVESFLPSKYPGTKIGNYKDANARLIRLSPQAKAELGAFINRSNPPISTQLHRLNQDCLCIFDPKYEVDRVNFNIERIDAIHPLIRWIVEENEKNLTDRHPCSSIILNKKLGRIEKGVYIYLVQLWSADGWKKKKELKFFASSINGKFLPENDAEQLVVTALREGSVWQDWDDIYVTNRPSDVLDNLVNYASGKYDEFYKIFISDNDHICNTQEDYATRTAKRKAEEANEVIDKLVSEGKTKPLRMWQGTLAKIQEQLEVQKARINQYRDPLITLNDLAIGIIKNGE